MNKKNKSITIVSITLGITLLIALEIIIVPTIAKFIKEQGNQSKIDSDNFYFTSDYLGFDEIPVYEIFGNSVTFEIRNYADSLRVNDTNIDYTVVITEGTVNKSFGTLLKDSQDSSKITLSYAFGEEEQKEIMVSVIGTGKYVKTLKAKFIFIKPIQMIKYRIEDSIGSNYMTLYISSAQTDMIANLSWDMDKLIIDETNDYVFDNVSYDALEHIGTVTTKAIAANTTAKIIFFKKNLTEDYSCGETVSSDGTIKIV